MINVLETLKESIDKRSSLRECFQFEESQIIELLHSIKWKFPIAYCNAFLLTGDPIEQIQEIYRDPSATGKKIIDKEFEWDSLNPLVSTAVPNFAQAGLKVEEYLELEKKWVSDLKAAKLIQ